MIDIQSVSEGLVSGSLHWPANPQGLGVVLTHGAGGNSQAPLLKVLAGGLAELGVPVLRCDLPFRQQRRFGPPFRAQAAEDREGLRRAVAYLRGRGVPKIVLGGHSYGGRQASILAAEDSSVAEALLLLSYPLHPPKKSAELRTQHFPQLRTPGLFVHGSRDPFGSLTEMPEAIQLIPGRTSLIEVSGAGHDLRKGEFDTTIVLTKIRELIQE